MPASPSRGVAHSDDELDPISMAVNRSKVAQMLKQARVETFSLAEPSRPMTPLDRSLFQHGVQDQRPSSSYSSGWVRQGFGARGIGTGYNGTIGEDEEADFSMESFDRCGGGGQVDVMR